MRVRISIMYFLVVSMLLSVVCYGNPKPKVRVGYWEDYGIVEDEKGNFSGYSYEYMNKIGQINGWDLEFVKCGWEEGLNLLAEGKIDIFGALQKTEQREELYDFTDLPFGFEYGALYINEENNTIYYDDPQSFDGKVVGTTKENYYMDTFYDYCEKEGIAVQYRYFEESDEMQEALHNGEVDMLLTGSLQTIDSAKVVLHLVSEPFYFAATKGNTMVLDGLQRGIHQIKRENLYFDAALNEKYFNETAIEQCAFTHEEVQYLNQHKSLKVVSHNDWKPFDYYDEKSGGYKGIGLDVLEYISDFTGIEFEIIKTNGYDQALNMVKNREANIVAGVIESRSITRMYNLTTTVPYVESALVFIGKRGSALNQLDGQYVAVPKNNVGTLLRLEQDFPKAQVKAYDQSKDCMNAVLKGDVTFAVLTTYAADDAMRDNRYNELGIVSVLNGEIPVCFGISNECDTALLGILDKAIRSMKADTMNEIIYEHTVGLPYNPTFMEFVRQNAVLIGCVIVVFAGSLMFLAYWANTMKTKELNQMAYFDQLTGRINFVKFKIEMTKILANNDTKWALLSLDINKFKSINDLLGYDYGDRLIIHLADCIAENLQEGELFARENADKFILLLHYRDDESIDKCFQNIALKADGMKEKGNTVMKLVLSGGLYVVHPEDKNITTIIDRANIARKLVKDSHRSAYAVYNQEMYEKLNREKQIENIMAQALAQGEFVVYLQPKFSIKTRGIVGAEALVRWQSPERGLIPPDEFIPLFEKNGFVVNIDFFVFREVCKKLHQWLEDGNTVVPISVNLSRRHISNQALAKELCEIAHEYKISPGLIELELTESAFTGEDIQILIEIMENLHEAGFVLSMDDFGSGLSSLTQLKQLPIDFLKLDRSFLTVRSEEKREEAMFRNVVNLSRDMGIATVAEGVETEEQYILLRETGCDVAQGYLFARPMSIEDFEKRFIFKTDK